MSRLGPYELDTIVVGDCLDVMRQMPDGCVDAVITDPPYNFAHTPRREIHEQLMRVSSSGAIVFCPPENQWQDTADQYLFWIKPISTKNTSKRYSRFVETIQVFGSPKWVTGWHWSQYTNVFHDLVEERMHPYSKPETLVARLVRNHSEAGDIIFDPFMGSGTTAVAAKKLGRHYFGCDINPEYVEMARKRVAKVDGVQLELAV